MASRMRARLTYANLMATVAVFIALGGGAYAAVAIPANSVGSKQLKKNGVTSTKIKNAAVTKTKIAKNSVDGSKVKDASLTGADINLATLPKVGAATNADNAAHAGAADNATNAGHATAADSATNAGHATAADNATHAGTADNIAPPEAWHEIGASGEPPFLGGSANDPSLAVGGATAETVAFYKDKGGVVHLKGAVKTASSGSLAGAVFNLPPGYRPANAKLQIFNAWCAANPTGCSSDSGTGGTSKEGYALLLVFGANSGLAIPGGSPDGLVLASQAADVSLDGITFRADG